MIDKAKLLIISGAGGDGSISGVRKKFVPRGGPDGGDGGVGGRIIVKGDKNLSSLKEVSFINKVQAQNGFPGSANNKRGKKGRDKIIRLPLGTLIYDTNDLSKKILREVTTEQKIVILEGGKGGRGNSKMANSVVQYPLLAEKGEINNEILIELDYRMNCDVAIIGKPNCGKSFFLSKITNAKPLIEQYPYSTTRVEKGVIETIKKQYTIIEIPGIEDSKNNLGIKNLKHIKRAKVLVFIKSDDEDETLSVINRVDKDLLKEKEMIIINSFHYKEPEDNNFKAIEIEEIKKEIERKVSIVPKKTEEIEGDPEKIVFDFEKEYVEKNGDVFEIKHQQVIRIAERVNLDHWDVMAQFMKTLHNKGISKRLFELGIKEGDTIKIGSVELEWS